MSLHYWEIFFFHENFTVSKSQFDHLQKFEAILASLEAAITILKLENECWPNSQLNIYSMQIKLLLSD